MTYDLGMHIVMPTDAEHRAASQAWFSRIDGTCLDQLPKEILALGPKTHFLEIDAARLMGMFDGDMIEAERLAAEADKITGWDRHFFKLTTRSAKDAFDGPGLTCSGKQALEWMASSMRIADDLQNLLWLDEYTAKLCVREPFYGLEGLGTWEFRCFVKGGDLIAVTDYDYTKPNARLQQSEVRSNTHKEISDFFSGAINPAMSLSDYVFDVAHTAKGWVLVEVNPYGLSDPCFLGSYDAVEAFSGDIAFEVSP